MINQNRLKNVLDYDPETGVFTWKIKPSQRVNIGDVAGTKTPRGYQKIMINGEYLFAHRLAWLYVYGEFPKNEIDHINQVTSDNRISNLRDVTHTENNKNAKMREDNSSGYTGVSWHKAGKKWQAKVKLNGKSLYLGLWKHKQDAIAIRQAANVIFGFHSNHGAGNR